MTRFFVVFLLIVAVLFTVELLPWTQQVLVIPFTTGIATLAVALMQTWDSEIAAQGKIIWNTANGFAVSIEAGCNGVEAGIILAAAMLAFPASWVQKLLGIAIGLVTVQVLNLVRIVTLFYLGQWHPTAFEWAHLYIWQALIMLDVLVVFMVWLRWVAQRSSLPRPGVAPGRDPLRQFLLRVLFWLPVCFAAWYYFSILFTIPLAALVDALMTWSFPKLVEQVAQQGNALTVVTAVPAQAAVKGVARMGTLVFEVNPLKYGYCVPLYTALLLATPASEAAKVIGWLVAMLLLTAVQVFGIATEILKTLAFQLTPEAQALLGFTSLGYEGLALAYQFGFLILPPAVPIVLWFVQFRPAVSGLLDRKSHPGVERGPSVDG
ncbi:exosortase H [uncultured Thiodictyon sp.]|jgi:exosortase H (IPTLxxWG-CTERM-specific)|uniref:exosortase H n=1 Tax=uncultured Thiodictyon sp. TaxID=1846217 RepID=UPI0025D225A6|nr:exosortase H [uncultured Thiodictyon sp.]